MANKKKYYLTLDTETATLPFANDIAEGDANKKKKIAIARPLIYDIGWVISDRQGNIIKKQNYLVSEIFCVPQIYNTAYYADKRPLYLEALKRKEIEILRWDEIMERLIPDMKMVDAVCAFNASFDYFKAIPFTELYIRKLYSADYQQWEEMQKKVCKKIANEPYKKNNEKEYDPLHFRFRGEEYDLCDLWGAAVDNLLNTAAYRKLCFEMGMLTATGEYFKTSAESSYRYLCERYDFDEAHTALSDAEIEAVILTKIVKKKALPLGVVAFPFRQLGTTVEWARNHKVKPEHIETILEIMGAKIQTYDEQSKYRKRLEKYVTELEQMR